MKIARPKTARLINTKHGITLILSFTKEDQEMLLLEKGKVPDGLITTHVLTRRR